MKIAITGDIHLTKLDNHPERWDTFENILNTLQSKNIQTLIITGDLFNADYINYSRFDKIVSRYDIRFIIIPGNHDSKITQKYFTAENIKIYDQPDIFKFGDSEFPFLFIPYTSQVTMGQEIVPFKEFLPDNEWVLISHGDWAENIKTPNPIEPGVYMPLSRKDIKNYKPKLTVLGHIHKPEDYTDYDVYYPGSPCPLSIKESGRRRVLTLDTENLDIDSLNINSEVLYFDETIIVYPMENEERYWEEEVKRIKDKWNLTDEEKLISKVRIKAKGFSSNKRKLKEYLGDEFKDFTFYKDGELDLTEVNNSDDFELMKISEKITERINQLNLDQSEIQPSKQEILYKSIEKIYSIK